MTRGAGRGPLAPSAPPARWAWALVVPGWALTALAPVLMARVADQLMFLSLAGVLLVAAGCVLLSGRVPLFGLAFVLVLPLLVGQSQADAALVYRSSGRTVGCTVTAVTRQVRQVPVHGAPQSPGALRPTDGSGTHLETRVSYRHRMRCPNASYMLGRTRPSPIGTRYDVTYDPTGRVPTVFSTGVPTVGPFLVVLLVLPALLLLVLPLLAWVVGRRPGGARPPHGGPTRPGPPQQPPAVSGWQQPPAVQGWQQPPPVSGWQQPPAAPGWQQPPAGEGRQQLDR
ncbi:hypothetical protein [Actinocatenispora comari]|uniref:DUF3592 domain-containing protein n=1 Tax=Actinocatenispora comari TaxID=2807577 RepID=A0A8J4AHV0_9ACTN|nr:hypothetical protein [Actinocatenispora comari]GIL28938.1 hypothetical protein NUM_41920 [Actinocatenispora comari]